MTGLLLPQLCMKIVTKLISKFTDVFPDQVTDVFPDQVLNFLNKIADDTKSIERISQLLCRNVIAARL